MSEIVSNIGSSVKHSIENVLGQQEETPLYEKAPVNTLENLSFADELEEANADYDNFADSQLNSNEQNNPQSNIFYEYSPNQNAEAPHAQSNKLMQMSLLNDTLEPELRILNSQVKSTLNQPEEGRYHINYDALVVKHRGKAYKDNQIVPWSNYRKSPGSPIDGDASRELQIKSIDALITASIRHDLDLRDAAHILAIANHESKFNPYAAAGTTSASGLGQFTNGTGEIYNIDDSNRWNIYSQAEALVRHFKDNKHLIKKYGLSESYIYKFHHDGPNSDYHHDSEGLRLSYKEIMPKIRGFSYAIHKAFN